MEPKKYSFDRLQMFFGEDYQVAEGIVISQPTIGEIMSFGEDRFNQVLNPFVVNPTSLRVMLWQQNIDWTEITDYELFCQLHSFGKNVFIRSQANAFLEYSVQMIG